MRTVGVVAVAATVLVFSAVSFLCGVLARRIVGPSPRAFLASISTPDT